LAGRWNWGEGFTQFFTTILIVYLLLVSLYPDLLILPNYNIMSLTEKIASDLINAMKTKDKVALEAIRAAKTAFVMARAAKGAETVLTSDEELKIIQKLVKQRRESAEIYRDQN
jgi:hypothetical protein